MSCKMISLHKILLAGGLLISATILTKPAKAQSELGHILQLVEQNNQALKAAGNYNEARKLELQIGLTPDDPEVSYSFQPGNRSELGDKELFSIAQKLDFPIVYKNRKEVAKEEMSVSDLQYEALRKSILLDAQLTYYDLVYHKKREQYLKKRVANTQKLYKSFNRKMEKGESTILEVNKARLQMTELENQCQMAQAQAEVSQQKLQWLAGNTPINLTTFEYTPEPLIPADSLWTEFQENDSELKIKEARVAVAGKKVKLRKSEGLPIIELGYDSESVQGTTYGGPKVGLSLPLWANKNKVKQARANQLWQENFRESERKESYFQLMAQYEQMETLKIAVANYDQHLSDMNNLELLRKSLVLGQISVINYFTEVNYYIAIFDNYLDTEKEYFKAMAILYAHRL